MTCVAGSSSQATWNDIARAHVQPMETPNGEGLASVTIDSSLIYPTTSRRFLMGLWEMADLRVELVPRAVQEMHGYVRESEKEQWHRQIKGDTERTGKTYPPETADAIAEAGAAAAGNWVNEELGFGQQRGREDSMLQAVALNAEQRVQTAAIALSIPRMGFRGPTKNDYRGDREIVAQGVATGFKILASDKRGSIVRNRINGWLTEAWAHPHLSASHSARHPSFIGTITPSSDTATVTASSGTTDDTRLLGTDAVRPDRQIVSAA